MKNVRGITLISLVITIIVLIILAGIAINLSLGENGIFVRSKQAKEMTNKQTATEKINLKITTAQMNKYAEKQVMPTLKELSEVLRDDDEIQYVTEKSQNASTKYEVGENPSSIFTKLNEYPYEFEINGQLQLASIDGIKVSNNIEQESTIWKKYMMNEDGYVMGSTEVTLPSNFSELYVKVYNSSQGAGYFYHFLYDSLSDEKQMYIEGANFSGNMNSTIYVSKTKLYLSAFTHASKNCISTTKVEIWYK